MATRFGQYELVRRLGSGGMGEVFLARLKRADEFEKLLVIKRMLPQLSDDESFREFFRREARLAARLSHQNIVQIFDYGEVDGQMFIAMEYVDGIDAATLLHSDAELTPQLILAIGVAAARGLDYAHRKTDNDGEPLGLVHRDVAPKNLLLSREGEVKWIDFGLARALGSVTARVAGTVPYMAPEQARGEPVDARADIFGLGVSMYELLTGELPFAQRSQSVDAQIDAVEQGELVPVSDRGVPAAFDPVLARMLAADRDERYRDARELLDALDVLDGLVGRATPQDVATTVRDAIGRQPERSAVEQTLVGDEPIAGDGPTAATEDAEAEGSQEPLGESPPDDIDSDAGSETQASSGLRTWHIVALAAGLVALVVVWSVLGGTSALSDAPEAASAARSESVHWHVTVTSTPSGATVALDGDVVGQTPHVFRALAPRDQSYALRIEASDYVPVTDELVLGSEGGELTREFALEPRPGRLTVRTRPDDATLVVNGKTVAPGRPVEVEPGRVALAVSRTGYAPHTETVEVEAGAREEVVVELTPLDATLSVETIPTGAQVELRSLEKGPLPAGRTRITSCVAPCPSLKLPSGRYRVSASLSGYETTSRTVSLSPGGRQHLMLECERVEQRSTFKLAARGSKAHFRVRGRPTRRLATRRGTFELRVGDSSLRGALAPASGRPGALLSLRAEPYAPFDLDGAVERKPLFERYLAPGRHRVRLPSGSGTGFDIRVP